MSTYAPRFEQEKTRILIADENPAQRAQLREALTRAGYRNFEEAVKEADCIGCAFCATMCPDCIIKVER